MTCRSLVRLIPAAILSIICLQALPVDAQLQQMTIEQKIPRVGKGVATWQVKRADPVTETYSIRVRNDTTVPIEVTRIHLSGCINLRVACDTLIPSPVVIAPKGIEDLVSFTPADPGHKTRFADQIDWRAVPECIHVDTAAAAGGRMIRPASRRMIVPPFPWPRALPSTKVQVDFFVAASGVPDSVIVTGLADASYHRTLDSAMRGYVFEPARVGRCPVAGTTHILLTFGR